MKLKDQYKKETGRTHVEFYSAPEGSVEFSYKTDRYVQWLENKINQIQPRDSVDKHPTVKECGAILVDGLCPYDLDV